MWWSDSGDDLENTMTRPIDLSVVTTAALTLKARYEIEAGFDYLYVQASTDGGTTWTSLDGTAGGEPFVRTASDQPAISGSSDGEWVDVNVPLDAYAGQAIELRFLYDTDGGVAPDGFFADEVSIVADGAPLFTSGAEEGDEGWTLDGFRATTGTGTGVFDNYYIASHRSFVSYDRYLKTGPYNFGFLNTRPDWEPIFRIDGPAWRSRVQIYDAPFSLTRARSFTLHVNGRASFIRGQNAQPVFDDSRPYWCPEIPQAGVKVPDTGTRIRVVSVDGTSMQIRVSSS